MNKESLYRFGLGVTAVIGAIEFSQWAFSAETKVAIKQRAREAHGGRLLSELSHTNGVPMECSHKNHDKSNPDYDNPENGMLVTIYEHLNQHINEEGRNGLPVNHNRSAIGALKHKIKVWEEVRDYDKYYQITSHKAGV